MTMTQKEDAYLKLPKSLLGLLWSILVSLVGVWWHSQSQQAQLRETMVKLSVTVDTLSETVTRLETRYDRYYLNSDAAKDLGFINGKLDDHEARLRRIEDRRK